MKAEIKIVMDDNGALKLNAVGGSVTDMLGMLETAKWQIFTDNIELVNSKFQVKPILEGESDES